MPKYIFPSGSWLLCLVGWLLTAPAWGQPPEDPSKLLRELGPKGFQEYMKKRREAATPVKLTPDEAALLEESRKGDLAAVTALLAKGVKPTIRAANGESPLGRAAAFGNNEIADLLLSKGAKIDDTDDMGTPLWWAANRGDAKRVAALLAQGADVNKQVGTPPVAIATIKGHAEIVKQLLDKGAKPDVFSCSLLGDSKKLAALLKQDPTLAKAIATQGVKNALSPLHLATEAGHVEVVELLLKNGADMWLKRNEDRKAPVELCATLPMLKLYLAKEDLLKTSAGAQLLSQLLSTNRPELAKYMLDQGVLPANAAWYLAGLDLEKDRGMIDLLIKNGAIKKPPGPYGLATALDYAIYSTTSTEANIFEDGEITVKRNRPLALWLIEQGIPLNQHYGRERELCTLNHAIRHDELEILKAMIDKGVNLTPQWRASDIPGQTMKEATYVPPPLIAAVRSKMDVIKLLVEKGVSVNDADPQTGYTPLHAAASINRRELVDYLLAQGANPKAKMRSGETPAQSAANRKHVELAAFLKSKE